MPRADSSVFSAVSVISIKLLYLILGWDERILLYGGIDKMAAVVGNH